MAVDFFTQPASGVITSGWVTVIGSDGDDVYAQQVATAQQSLLLADNASFLRGQFVSNINQYSTVYVTNGSRLTTTQQTSDGYPFLSVGSDLTGFVLPTGTVDNVFESVFCRFSNGQGGQWEFTAPAGSGLFFDFSGPITLTDLNPGAPGPKPQTAFVSLREDDPSRGQAVLIIDWDTTSLDPTNNGMDATSPPTVDFISYDSISDLGRILRTASLVASSNSFSTFSLPVGATAIGEIVAGSLRGTVEIPQFGVAFDFAPQILGPFSGGLLPLAFRRSFTTNPYASTANFTFNGYPRELDGFVDMATGTITLRTFNDSQNTFQEVGPLAVSATYARYQPQATAADFTLFAGQTFTRALGVDLLGAGSTIAIQSPVTGADFVELRASNVRIDAPTSSDTRFDVAATLHGIAYDPTSLPASQNFTTTAGGLSFATANDQTALFTPGTQIALTPIGATPVIRRVVSAVFTPGAPTGTTIVTLNAPIDNISTSGDVYLISAITAEQAFFNAAVAAAGSFDIRLAEDPNTPAVERSKLFVSTTGSLAGSLPVAANGSVGRTGSIYAQVETGDILVEGKIVATNHSYLMQSAQAGAIGERHNGPYYFSTTSQVSGGDTGLIDGDVVAITLGNDLPTVYSDTANGGSSAFNEVTLTTEINSLRVRAADQKGDPQQVPFPYDLKITDKSDLVVDAVAASSLPIQITSAGNMNFRATLISANDISLESTAGNLQLNAPLSTMFGKIALTGSNLTVGNSVRVFDGFSDDLVTDIVLTATNGDLNLVGPISAVNKVELSQTGNSKVGKIYGNARVIADTVSFDATGSVSLGTDVRAVTGRAGGEVTITEVNDLYADISLTTVAKVTITANGVDYGELLDDTGNYREGAAGSEGFTATGGATAIVLDGDQTNMFTAGTAIGLRASTPTANPAVKRTVVSATYDPGTTKTTVTISAAIDPTTTAGDAFRIVSTPALQARVTDSSALVLSAPKGSILVEVPTSDTVVLGDKTALSSKTATAMSAAGSVTIRSSGGAIDVLDAPVAGRAAREVRLVATGELPNSGPNAYDPRVPGTFPGTLTATANGLLTIGGITPRVRDTVLLVGQTTAFQNGVYTVLDVGSTNSKWKLSRLAEYDTTAEMPLQTRFRVTDGPNIDRIYSVSSYADTLDATPVSVTAVPNRFGAFPVRAVSTGVLAATLSGGVIESKASQQIPTAFFDGVLPDVGDLVLVRLGIDSTSPSRPVDTQANGVYQVVDIGGGSSKWKLQRVATTEFDIANGGLVVADEGTLRGRATGNAFQVRFNSLGEAALTIKDITSDILTNIGSDDYTDTVTFVVSTNGTTNDAAGSLGKMLLLSQQNVATDPLDSTKPQQQSLRFGNTVAGAIRLVQELPRIEKAVTVDALLPRYQLGVASSTAPISIDGSTISKLRNGTLPSATSEINGFEVKGSGASGTVIAGLQVAGFSKGAAIKIDGTSSPVDTVRINKMTLGLDSLGRRVPNKVGILTTGDVGDYTTLSNNIVLASTTAGIQIKNTADGIRLVGNEVGRSRFENKVGILVEGGSNRIGVAPAGNAPSAVTASYVSRTEFSVPNTFAGLKDLYVGLGVTATDITPNVGKTVAFIKSIALPDANNRTKITIEDGSIASGITSLTVQFGLFATFTADADTIVVPEGTQIDELFLGQLVSAAPLATGTTIKAIDKVSNTITLSGQAASSGLLPVTFGGANRNAVRYNLSGIELAGGANRLVATDVSNSVFDGVKVSAGTQRIGYGGLTVAGDRNTAKDLAFSTSNAIFSSGGYGINVTSTGLANFVTIQGNYLGTNNVGASALPNRRGNISPEGGVGRTTAPVIAARNVTPGVTILLRDEIVVQNRPAVPAAADINKIHFQTSDRKSYLWNQGTSKWEESSEYGVVTFNFAADHGLATGRRLFVTTVTAGGVTQPLNLATPAMTFVSTTVAKASLTKADRDLVIAKGVPSGTTTTGTAVVEFYGPTAKLSEVDNIDFEGNVHGLSTGATGGGSGIVGTTPSTPRPGTGRPIAPPVRRR